MSVYLRDSGWWVDVSIPPYPRQRVTANTFDKKEAIQFEAQLRADIKSGSFVFDEVKAKPTVNNMTLEQGFERAYRTTWINSKDITSINANVKIAYEYFGKTCKLRDITTATVSEYTEWLQSNYNSPATVNRKLSTLQRMLTLANTKWDMLDKPVSFTKLSEPTGRIRTISFETEAVLVPLACELDPLMGDLVMFLLDTGCRLSEALRLSKKDIKKDHVEFWMTKFKYRSVPMSSTVSEILGRHKDKLMPFAGLGNIYHVEHLWRKIRTQMGEDESFILHALRHTFATRMIEATGDIYTVSKYLGHANVSTTERYAKIMPAHLRTSMAQFEALKNRNTVSLLRVINKE